MSEKSQGVILILHGWQVPVEQYFPLKDLFIKAGFQVLVPQLPGFVVGEALASSYDLDDYVEFVNDFLKKKKIASVFLIGHSFGGRVAIKLAALHPKKIKALVLTGVPAIRTQQVKRFAFLILAKIGKALCVLPPFCLFRKWAMKILYYFVGEWDYYKAKGAMRESFRKIVAEDLSSFLFKIKVPTLLLWGEDDRIVPVSAAQKIVSKIPRAELIVIPSVSHKLPYENPKIFSEGCLEFFRHQKL